jgi:hypothetical protein
MALTELVPRSMPKIAISLLLYILKHSLTLELGTALLVEGSHAFLEVFRRAQEAVEASF